jgi:hypothetical protein
MPQAAKTKHKLIAVPQAAKTKHKLIAVPQAAKTKHKSIAVPQAAKTKHKLLCWRIAKPITVAVSHLGKSPTAYGTYLGTETAKAATIT